MVGEGETALFCTILVQLARLNSLESMSIFSPIHLAFALPRKSIKKYIFPLFDCCGVGARPFELQGFNGPSGITVNTQTELFAFLRRQGFADPTRVINRVHH
jgi:hypothetical protein